MIILEMRKPLDMEDVYNTYFSPVYNYVFYRLLNRENTEDVVSLVFEKVMTKLHTFDPSKASLKTWIFRITDNALVDYYRRRRPSLSMDCEESGLENTLHIHFDEQYEQIMEPERRMLLEAMARLPERDRLFIYYKYYENITNREIARRLEMNESTVAAVLARARQKLKVLLEENM